MSSITISLNDIFRKHRLVFWYDPGGEMRAEIWDNLKNYPIFPQALANIPGLS